MLLMAADGLFGEVPELAIFADTMHEPLEVYDHLAWLRKEVADKIEVVSVTAGDLLEEARSRQFNPIPLYVRQTGGSSGAGRRQCTKEWKLYPIRHELRRRGFSEKRPVEMWIGISIDEFQRMKPSGLQWVENRWPLIEHDYTRTMLKGWFNDRYPGRRLAKSACYFCPYKREREFAQMRRDDPVSFAKAVAADEAMRDAGGGKEQFVLSSLKPLSEATSVEDEGQLTFDAFDAECEGLCGV